MEVAKRCGATKTVAPIDCTIVILAIGSGIIHGVYPSAFQISGVILVIIGAILLIVKARQPNDPHA